MPKLMIRAIYRNGEIQPLDEIPSDWQDGQELVVDLLANSEPCETIEQWNAEMDAAGAGLTDEDDEEFMKALDEVERRSKELGRREMEKAGSLFVDDVQDIDSCEAG
jgi:hypothetical protein